MNPKQKYYQEFKSDISSYISNGKPEKPYVVIDGTGLIPFFILRKGENKSILRATTKKSIADEEDFAGNFFGYKHGFDILYDYNLHNDKRLVTTGYFILDKKQKKIVLFDASDGKPAPVGKEGFFTKQGFNKDSLLVLEETLLEYMKDNLPDYHLDIMDYGLWNKDDINIWFDKEKGIHYDTNDFYYWGLSVIKGLDPKNRIPSLPPKLYSEHGNNLGIKKKILEDIIEIIPTITIPVRRVYPKKGNIEKTEMKLDLDTYKKIVGISQYSGPTTQGIFLKIVNELGKKYPFDAGEFC